MMLLGKIKGYLVWGDDTEEGIIPWARLTWQPSLKVESLNR